MRTNIFDICDEELCQQGSTYGIKSLGFYFRNPNKEADRMNLHKYGFSRRGTPTGIRPVSNSKRRGLKAMHKKYRRESIRYMI